jgi:hypothetical protein
MELEESDRTWQLPDPVEEKTADLRLASFLRNRSFLPA